MIETAEVIYADEKKATVRVQRTTACGECGKCMIGKKDLSVDATLDNTLNVKTGESVYVELSLGGLMKASYYMYGIPLAAFVAGCLIGYYILSAKLNMSADVCGFVFGLILTAVAYLLLKFADKKGAFSERYKITMVEKVKPAAPCVAE